MRAGAIHIVAALALVGTAMAQQGEAKEERLFLPSGLEVGLQEMLWDRPGNGLTYRFRFVAPGFKGGDEDFAMLSADLEFLCNEYALVRLSNQGPVPNQVIISLADRNSEFGVIDPDVTQVFEAYRVENGVCIWEMF